MMSVHSTTLRPKPRTGSISRDRAADEREATAVARTVDLTDFLGGSQALLSGRMFTRQSTHATDRSAKGGERMRNRLRLALTAVSIFGILGVGGAAIAQAASSGSSTSTNKSSGSSTTQSQNRSQSNNSSKKCPNM